MQNIEKEIADNYDFDVKSIAPFKDISIINTTEGKKVLKKNILSQDRILFIHAAKEHLVKNNFLDLDRYLCNTNGVPFINIEGMNYTISNAIEGIECNFDNRIDITNATNSLARMHKASKGFIAPDNSRERDELGKLPVYFGKRLEEIKKLKKVAKRGKTKFDYLFLDYVDYFYVLGEKAIQSLSSSKYEEIVKAARQEGSFCHHDFTHHNIICNKDRTYITNFDFCSFELKVYDLANLIRRKMRKCNWDINEAKVIVDEYRSIESIVDDELLIMKIMLQFPQKFWRVINKYYNSKRSWSEKSFISKLYEVIGEVEDHKNFMQRFELLV